jgi:hypothetical protein
MNPATQPLNAAGLRTAAARWVRQPAASFRAKWPVCFAAYLSAPFWPT